MDFELTTEQKMLKRAIREFAEKEIAPLVDEAEEKEKFPAQILPKMASLGYLGVAYPPECGGVDVAENKSIRGINECIWYEGMARVSPGIAFGIQCAAVGTPGYVLRDYGNEEQKQRYLVPCIGKGEKIGAIAITEAEAGSDISSMKTTAARENDTYVLNGSKIFISGGNIADFIIVAAYTDKSAGTRGMSLLILDKGTSGFEIGQKFEKIGHRATENAELLFTDCRIPGENLIGEEGRGWYQLMGTLNSVRIGDSARAVGTAQGAYEAALAYAKERIQFGQPIGKFEGVSFKLADMHMRIEAARLLTYNAAWALGQENDARLEVSTARLYAAEMVREVTTGAMQTLGGYSFIKDSPVQRYWRDAYLFYFGYGTEEVQKLIISRAIGL